MAMTETRRLAAIMFTDIVGFSRQMGVDEARMLKVLAVHNEVIQQAVAEHHGHVIKTMGDGFLVDFPSVVNAVQCAQHIQAHFRTHNAQQETTEQIHVRIGVHLGDIIHQNGDVLDDGVNVASRLQALAEPDTICISHVVYREVEKKLPLGTVVALGRPKLKNIAQREPVYCLLPERPQGVRQQLQVQRLKLQQKRRALQVGALGLVLGLVSVATLLVKDRYLSAPTPEPPKQGTLSASQAPLPLPDKPSIVVLPLVNMSGDPGQDYFSDGMTEELTASLSRLSSLFVISRNSAFFYKGKAVKMPDLSKELGVKYVLEGSVRKAGDQVRITAQLIDASKDQHLWSERYDRSLQDLFVLQDEIVQRIVTTLKLQLTLVEQGVLVHKTTDDLDAYEYYLRGMAASNRFTKEENAQARQMYEKALALDPQNGDAYARLGWTYYLEWSWQWSADPQNLERALTLAQQAIALDDSLAAAHGLLGTVYARKKQYDQALAEGERAVALDPNNAEGYTQQANVLNFVGRPEEALRAVEQAMRLNPHYPLLYLVQLGWAYQLTGRYAEAIGTLKTVVVRNPNFLGVYGSLILSYLQQWIAQLNHESPTLEQAFEAAQRAVTLNDSNAGGHILLGYVYLLQKHYEQAIAELERGVTLAANEAGSYAVLAEGLSRVGKAEDALRSAEQALRLQHSGAADQHLSSIGVAYYLAGRSEEAMAPLKKFLSRYPNILGPHLTLAAVYSELGKEAEARAEVAEVLRINPQFSLEIYRQRVPIKDPLIVERHIAALHKAGLK